MTEQNGVGRSATEELDLAETPCGSCAHMAQRFGSGRVMCQGIYVHIPKKVKTWRITEPHMWLTRPNGTRYANCDHYEKVRQTRMEVGE